jgi:methionine-rich copper-binding protein CopC
MPAKAGILLLGCALTLGVRRTQIAPFSLVLAEPAAGGTFNEAPTRIRLIFSERLEPSKGEVSLVGSDGRTIRLTAAMDPHLVDAIIAPVPLLPPLQPGAYHVEWRVVSARGLSLSGSYAFPFGPTAPVPPSGDSAGVSTFDRFLARTELSPPVRRGAALFLALALVALIWVRRRARRPM